MRRLHLILLLILLVLTAYAIAMRQRVRLVAPVQGQVSRVVVGPSGVYWIERASEGKPAALFRATGLGQPGEQLASAPDIRDAFAIDDDLYYLSEEGGPGAGRLTRVNASGPPQALSEGLKAPQGLLATADRLYWAETRPSPVPGIACVPILQPLSMVYAADRAGQGKRLLAVLENADTYFAGKLLGEHAEHLYWMQQFGQQYNRAITTISRLPVQGGDPEELVRVIGSQDAILGPDMIYWTALSEERTPPEAARTVYRRPLSGGEPEKLTDWMSIRGVLFMLGKKVHYVDDRIPWRMPSELDVPIPLADLRVEPNSVAVARGTVYGYHESPQGRTVMRYPLTLGAHLRGLLRLL